MSVGGEHIADLVATAAQRTVASRTSRLFAAWSTGSPVPQQADRACEGVADFDTRRAWVWQEPFFTAELTAKFIEQHQNDDELRRQFGEPQEMIYDGANCYLRVEGNWTGFFLGDPAGPRSVNDPLWPLDALFGADSAAEIGPDLVRGVATTRYRVTIDLARADAALPAGVTVPRVPYRALSQVPAEAWLDAAGLTRRISVTTDTDPGAEDEPVWSIVELWDFGVAADIVPPTPGEVLPASEAYGACETPPKSVRPPTD